MIRPAYQITYKAPEWEAGNEEIYESYSNAMTRMDFLINVLNRQPEMTDGYEVNWTNANRGRFVRTLEHAQRIAVEKSCAFSQKSR